MLWTLTTFKTWRKSIPKHEAWMCNAKFKVPTLFIRYPHSPLSSQPSPTMLITDLPTEVLHHVLNYIKTDSFLIIGTVCSAFHHCYNTRDEKVTRTTKFFQSPQLLEQAPHIAFKFDNSNLLDDLIGRDNIQIIPLLLSRGLEWDPFCVERAAQLQHYKFFDWLFNTTLAWLPENAHCSAAEAGNLDLMIYLVEKGDKYPDSTSLAAASRQNFSSIVGWLRELELDRAYEMVRAAREDRVDVFEQMQVTEQEHVDMYITEACANSSFDVLEFFRSMVGVGPTIADVAMASLFKRFEVVEWFWEFFPELAKELP